MKLVIVEASADSCPSAETLKNNVKKLISDIFKDVI